MKNEICQQRLPLSAREVPQGRDFPIPGSPERASGFSTISQTVLMSSSDGWEPTHICFQECNLAVWGMVPNSPGVCIPSPGVGKECLQAGKGLKPTRTECPPDTGPSCHYPGRLINFQLGDGAQERPGGSRGHAHPDTLRPSGYPQCQRQNNKCKLLFINFPLCAKHRTRRLALLTCTPVL